jgi:hypothetical protein
MEKRPQCGTDSHGNPKHSLQKELNSFSLRTLLMPSDILCGYSFSAIPYGPSKKTTFFT